jgi:hypothetical protein
MIVLTHQKEIVVPPACCTLNVSAAEQKRLVAMFKALGNPIRFEIMKFLVTHPGCITGDILIRNFYHNLSLSYDIRGS